MLAKVQALKGKYDDSTCRKKALEEELSDLEGKLERAEKLVQGLAGGLGTGLPQVWERRYLVMCYSG